MAGKGLVEVVATVVSCRVDVSLGGRVISSMISVAEVFKIFIEVVFATIDVEFVGKFSL